MIHLPFIRPHQSPTFALAWFVSPAHGTVARRLMLPTSRPWNWHISTTTPGIDIGWTWSHWGTGVARGLFLLWGYGRHSRGVLLFLMSDYHSKTFLLIPEWFGMIWNDLFLGNLALNWGAELHRLLVRLMHTHAKHWARLGTENARANKKKLDIPAKKAARKKA